MCEARAGFQKGLEELQAKRDGLDKAIASDQEALGAAEKLCMTLREKIAIQQRERAEITVQIGRATAAYGQFAEECRRLLESYLKGVFKGPGAPSP